jgi:hypothetical protein
MAVALVIATSSVIKLMRVESKEKQDTIILGKKALSEPKATKEGIKDASEIVEEKKDAPEIIEEVEDTPEVIKKVKIAPEIIENVESTPEIIEKIEDTPEIIEKVEDAPEIIENVEKRTSVIISDLQKQDLYIKLIDIFYDKGNLGQGDKIPLYPDFKRQIGELLPTINEKDIKDFLLICNLFKITEFKEGVGYFEKSFEDAISLVSKI